MYALIRQGVSSSSEFTMPQWAIPLFLGKHAHPQQHNGNHDIPEWLLIFKKVCFFLSFALSQKSKRKETAQVTLLCGTSAHRCVTSFATLGSFFWADSVQTDRQTTELTKLAPLTNLDQMKVHVYNKILLPPDAVDVVLSSPFHRPLLQANLFAWQSQFAGTLFQGCRGRRIMKNGTARHRRTFQRSYWVRSILVIGTKSQGSVFASKAKIIHRKILFLFSEEKISGVKSELYLLSLAHGTKLTFMFSECVPKSVKMNGCPSFRWKLVLPYFSLSSVLIYSC